MNHSHRLDKHENLLSALLRRIDKLEKKQHNDYNKNKCRVYKVLNYNKNMVVPEVEPAASAKFVTAELEEDEDILVEAVKVEIMPAAIPVKDDHVDYLQRVGVGVFRY